MSEIQLCSNVRTSHICDTMNTDKTIYLVILDTDLTNLSIDISQYQVKVFFKDEINECVDYITSGITGVYLFISHITVDTLLPLIRTYQHLKTIYIFCKDQQCQICLNREPQTRNIFHDINIMFTQFQEDLNKQKPKFCFVGSTQQSFNSNNSAASWWKFFHKVLQHIQHTDIAKGEYTALCREDYADNKRLLRHIEKFEKTYTSNAAIFSYTRDSFVYHLLSRILRIGSLNDIFINFD